jgi:hypothetical protein
MNKSRDNDSDQREPEGAVKKLTLRRDALKKLKIRTGIATGGIEGISGVGTVKGIHA